MATKSRAQLSAEVALLRSDVAKLTAVVHVLRKVIVKLEYVRSSEDFLFVPSVNGSDRATALKKDGGVTAAFGSAASVFEVPSIQALYNTVMRANEL